MTKQDQSNAFADIDDATPSEILGGTQLIESKHGGAFALTDLETDLAEQMGVDLSGDLKTLVRSATNKTNQALNLVIESGLQLLAAKRLSERSENRKDNAKPEFMEALEASGMPSQRAYEAMSMAKYAAGLPADQREEMLALPKTKVMLLAQADPEVVADLFADEDTDIKALSVRELKQQIRQLKADKAQGTVELRRAEAQVEKLEGQIQSIQQAQIFSGNDIIPPHVSDLRLEIAALNKKAELSIDSMGRSLNDIFVLDGEWSKSSARYLFIAVQSLHTQTAGNLTQLHKLYGSDLNGEENTLERLTPDEVFKCAMTFKQLTAEHEHEQSLREYEREQDKPKGRGRPKAAPKQ